MAARCRIAGGDCCLLVVAMDTAELGAGGGRMEEVDIIGGGVGSGCVLEWTSQSTSQTVDSIA